MNAQVKTVIYLVEIDALNFLNSIEPNVVTINQQIDVNFYAEDAKQVMRVNCQMVAAQKFPNRDKPWNLPCSTKRINIRNNNKEKK